MMHIHMYYFCFQIRKYDCHLKNDKLGEQFITTASFRPVKEIITNDYFFRPEDNYIFGFVCTEAFLLKLNLISRKSKMIQKQKFRNSLEIVIAMILLFLSRTEQFS